MARNCFTGRTPQGDNIKGSAVLVHGSSGSSDSMHPMATALAAAGVHELLQSQELQGMLQSAGKVWAVQLLPGVQHIPLTLDPTALKAIVDLTMQLHYH